MVRREHYLYLTSPSSLTAIDVADPARPRIVSQLPFHPPSQTLYGLSRPLAWQDNRLLESRLFPSAMVSYDLHDPAHPAEARRFTYHSDNRVEGSGRALYRIWQPGVMEFRAADDGLQALRYLRTEHSVIALAAADRYVYALTVTQQQMRQVVLAFRTSP